MSQNDAMARSESQKFKTVLSLIGTVLLKVCEGPERVTEKWNGLEGMCLCGHVCACMCVYVSVYISAYMCMYS